MRNQVFIGQWWEDNCLLTFYIYFKRQIKNKNAFKFKTTLSMQWPRAWVHEKGHWVIKYKKITACKNYENRKMNNILKRVPIIGKLREMGKIKIFGIF